MEPQWIYFHRNDGEDSIGILLDLGAQRRLEKASYPILLTYAVNVYHAAETKEQAELVRQALVLLEETLQERLTRAGAGEYIGRIDSQTRVEYVFYVRDEAAAMAAVRHVATAGIELRTRCHAREDEGHSFYRTYLYPSPREKLHASNTALLQGLRADGYKTGREQRIHFWLRFLDKRGYEEGKRELGELGYRIENSPTERPSGHGYLLQVSRIGMLDAPSLNEATDGLYKLAASRGGIYEGWGLQPRRGTGHKLRAIVPRLLGALFALGVLAGVVAIVSALVK